jgi:uncharacterized membrane protein
MLVSYNKIAGGSAKRLAALSDGVFAVAMTLLLLELHVPAREAIHAEHKMLHAIAAFGPQLAVYLMSSLTLGNLPDWAKSAIEPHDRSNRDLRCIHLAR